MAERAALCEAALVGWMAVGQQPPQGVKCRGCVPQVHFFVAATGQGLAQGAPTGDRQLRRAVLVRSAYCCPQSFEFMPPVCPSARPPACLQACCGLVCCTGLPLRGRPSAWLLLWTRQVSGLCALHYCKLLGAVACAQRSIHGIAQLVPIMARRAPTPAQHRGMAAVSQRVTGLVTFSSP